MLELAELEEEHFREINDALRLPFGARTAEQKGTLMTWMSSNEFFQKFTSVTQRENLLECLEVETFESDMLFSKHVPFELHGTKTRRVKTLFLKK